MFSRRAILRVATVRCKSLRSNNDEGMEDELCVSCETRANCNFAMLKQWASLFAQWTHKSLSQMVLHEDMSLTQMALITRGPFLE